MTWPDVAVILLTYRRTEYALTTLASLIFRFHYSGPVHLHIADDGSDPEHREALVDCAKTWGSRHIDPNGQCYRPFDSISVSNSERHGYGASYNLATQNVHDFAPVILPLEDDWELTRPLDLDPLVADLQVASSIRMGYIGWTEDLRGVFRGIGGRLYLELDPTSPERHVFAGHPRLETRDYQRRVGPWPEHTPAGTTEFMVAGRPETRDGVFWPLWLMTPNSPFAHIGTELARED